MKLTRGNVLTWGHILALVGLIMMSLTWNAVFTATATGMLLAIIGSLLPIVFLIMLWTEWDTAGTTPLGRLYGVSKEKGSYGSVKTVEAVGINLNIKKFLIWTGIILFFFYVGKLSFKVGNDCKEIYNTSKMYHNVYLQKTQEKVGFYDKMWKTYYSKDKITNINKETFLQVTKIIMENRKDGEQVTWKWVHENQQIPYEEFTKFYSDLSAFIEAQRESYFAIEKVCQGLANEQNTLLDTFPNNLYNKMLGCEKIKFEYGFTSDQTEEVFRSKKENPQ